LVWSEGFQQGIHCSKTTTIHTSSSTIPVLSLTGASYIAFDTTYSPLRIATLALGLLVRHAAKTRVSSYEAKSTKWEMMFVYQIEED